MPIFRRSLFAATAIASLAGAAQIVGCGDSTNDSPPTPDAKADADARANADAGATPATGGPVPTVSDSRVKIYLGQTVKIDGSKVAPGLTADVEWTVVSTPSGSTITDFEDPTSRMPRFKPDLFGTYTLQMSGRKDGEPASVLVFVEASDAPVFWLRTNLVLNLEKEAFEGFSATTHAGGAYGGGDRTLNCAAISTPSDVPGGNPFNMRAYYATPLIASGADVWEGPPGSPSRVVFVDATMSEGGLRTSLSVATSESSCGSPDSKALETLTADSSEGTVRSVVENARFSPSGNRIAYLRDIDGKARLATIAFDGSAKRELAPFYGTGAPGGGLDADAGSPIPTFSEDDGVSPPKPVGQLTPRWKDETHVGWITFVGPDANSPEQRAEWELYVVEDAAGASAARLMHCSVSQPTSFDFLPDGTIVAAARHLVTTPEGFQAPVDLLVYRANATTGECEIVRNLTNFKKTDDVARDLALSPDQSQIAFFYGLESSATSIVSLFSVPADGSSAGQQIPGTEKRGKGAGPRWIAGGTGLTWGESSTSLSSTDVGRQLSIPATGGVARPIVTGGTAMKPLVDGGLSLEISIVSGIGQGCGVSRGPVSPGFMAAGGALGFIALVALRRRRASNA